MTGPAPGGSWTRGVVIALFMLAVFAGIGLAASEPVAARQDANEAVGGTLRSDARLDGVTVRVHDLGGGLVGEATTGADGEWRVELPGPGSYLVTLDAATLPDGVVLRDGDRSAVQVDVRARQQRSVLFPLTSAEPAPLLPAGRVTQRLLDGAVTGLVLALLAVGLWLLLQTTALLNLAHAELGALAALLAFLLNAGSLGVQLHLVPAAVLAIAAVALLGTLLERGLWHPLRERGRGALEVHVVALALALLLHHVTLVLLHWGGGGQLRPYRQFAVQQPVSLGPVTVTPRDLAVAAVAALVLLATALVIRHTRTGAALRALADDPDLAATSGMAARPLRRRAWAIAAGLAALGGVLLGVSQGPGATLGFRPFLLVVATMLLGGSAAVGGVVAGSIAVGIAVEASSLVWPGDETILVAAGVLLLLWLRSRRAFGAAAPGEVSSTGTGAGVGARS